MTSQVAGAVVPRSGIYATLRESYNNACPPYITLIKYHRLAGAVGIEPTLKVLETLVLPLYYAPIKRWYLTIIKIKSLTSDAVFMVGRQINILPLYYTPLQNNPLPRIGLGLFSFFMHSVCLTLLTMLFDFQSFFYRFLVSVTMVIDTVTLCAFQFG